MSKDWKPEILPDPPYVEALFGSSRFAWIWTIVRLYVGWAWLVAGWGKIHSPAWARGRGGGARVLEPGGGIFRSREPADQLRLVPGAAQCTPPRRTLHVDGAIDRLGRVFGGRRFDLGGQTGFAAASSARR